MKTGPGAAEIAGGNKVRSEMAAGLHVISGLWIVLLSDKVLVRGGGSSMKTASPYWVEGTDSSDTRVTSTRPNSFIATVLFPAKGFCCVVSGWM